jgi:cytidylate kinase
MSHDNFLDRQAHALGGAYSYRHGRHPLDEDAMRENARRMTVAVSREVGTPAGDVAREVGRRLNWPVYEHELLERLAEDLHAPVRALERMDERPQSWLLECIEGFGPGVAVSESRYVLHLSRLVRTLAKRGSCVIVGHGAAFLLPPHATLRVRLVGTDEDRAAAVARHEHLNRDAALARLHELDRERALFVGRHFLTDPHQPENYDLVVNTSEWSVPWCAELILQALNHRTTQPARGGVPLAR